MRTNLLIILLLCLCFSHFAHALTEANLQYCNLTPSTVNVAVTGVGASCWKRPPSTTVLLTNYAVSTTQNIDSRESQCAFTIAALSGSNVASLSIKYNKDHYEAAQVSSNGLLLTATITGDGIVKPYDIVVYIAYDPKSWMSKDANIQKSKLRSVCIPGAHDAAMRVTSICTEGGDPCNTQTQNLNVEQMLNAGVRHFDLRPVVFPKQPLVSFGHLTWGDISNLGCAGDTIVKVLSQVKNFISKAPKGEVVVLEFSHFIDMQNHNVERSLFGKDTMQMFLDMVQSELGPYLYKSSSDPFIDPTIGTIAKDGAKVIVIIDCCSFSGNFVFNGSNGLYFTPVYFENRYTETTYIDRMIEGQTKLIETLDDSTYLFLSWTLTQNRAEQAACIGKDAEFSILRLAEKANEQLPKAVEICKKYNKYPSILYTDRITPQQQYVINAQLNRLRFNKAARRKED